MSKPRKVPLVAFDFDYTIVNQNTDLEVQTTAPGGCIPLEIKEKWDSSKWTEYMKSVFQHLHSRSVTKNCILNRMSDLTFTPGFKELLSKLCHDIGAELIIISDSNSVFIDHILETHKLKEYFTAIYTNPAFWSDNGLLNIHPYHHQNHCDMSSANLCKGDILKNHINDSSKEFSFIAYVGDGSNDFCPMFSLSSNDLAFVRKGYSLESYMEKQKQRKNREIKASIFYWNDGFDILAAIENKIN